MISIDVRQDITLIEQLYLHNTNIILVILYNRIILYNGILYNILIAHN